MTSSKSFAETRNRKIRVNKRGIIEYKIGDCIKTSSGIGKIIDIVTEDGEVEWEVDLLQLANGSLFFGNSGYGGIVRYRPYLTPFWISKNCELATEEDYLKALHILQMGDMSFKAILKKDNSVTL